MIKLLRTIHQSHNMENKTGINFKYVIGETVLVKNCILV